MLTFEFDDLELKSNSEPGSPNFEAAEGIAMRPLAESQEKATTFSTGSSKSSSVKSQKNGSPTAKRPKRRVQTISGPKFEDVYALKEDILGKGAYAAVRTCVNQVTGKEYAVKIIEKRPGCGSRTRVIKEIESFHMCANHPNIVQLIEYFEEDNTFYLIFEKMSGGPLLNHIQRQICFTEHEARLVVKDIANALKFLHDRGIAHRDVKPENCLCTYPDQAHPVKLCDLDLASKMHHQFSNSITTPELQSPVGSAEFMAPEVVDAFVGEALTYDKRCDLWSLGVILYIMLCGYPPFYGDCWRENCGWDQGLPCSDCQEALFGRIQKGLFDFPEEDWHHISENAMDLVRHLLVRDVRLRYTADDVLRHPWMQEELPKTPLQTPEILQRKDSIRDMQQLNENFNAFTRIMTLQRLSRENPAATPDRILTNVPNPSGGFVGVPQLGKPPGKQVQIPKTIVEMAQSPGGNKARLSPVARLSGASGGRSSGPRTACTGPADRHGAHGSGSDEGVAVKV